MPTRPFDVERGRLPALWIPPSVQDCPLHARRTPGELNVPEAGRGRQSRGAEDTLAFCPSAGVVGPPALSSTLDRRRGAEASPVKASPHAPPPRGLFALTTQKHNQSHSERRHGGGLRNASRVHHDLIEIDGRGSEIQQ